jgi:hypothetical protein
MMHSVVLNIYHGETRDVTVIISFLHRALGNLAQDFVGDLRKITNSVWFID